MTHAPADPLADPTRKRIIALLERTPGLHVAEIARRLDLTWQGARHHLLVLEDAQLLSSALVRRRRVYYAGALAPQETLRERALISPSAVRLARAILAEPGLTVLELARRAGLTRRVAYHHALLLRGAGLVTAAGEPLRFAPAPMLEAVLGDR